MIAWLADENFNGIIVRALLLRQPSINLLRVQDVGLMGADDATILAWCAENGRLLLTHDASTLPDDAFARVARRANGGIFITKNALPPATVVDDLLMVEQCSEPSEWEGRVIYLPL